MCQKERKAKRMKEQIEQIKLKSIEEIKNSTDLKNLEELRVKYLGKKGELTAVLRGMKDLSPEERPAVGSLVNEVRDALESKIKENDIIKTTITFNPRIYQEAQIIAALYEKGKFSTNIKATLIRAVCNQNPMLSDNSMFLEMNEEDLVSCLGILLYTIDKKGIDISKMVMGYCNIQPQIITTEGVIPSDGNNPNENIEEEDLEDLTEDVENCGIDLC